MGLIIGATIGNYGCAESSSPDQLSNGSDNASMGSEGASCYCDNGDTGKCAAGACTCPTSTDTCPEFGAAI